MGQSLQGRVAVVTGASRGIGKGIAVELGAQGATVYVTGRTTAEGGVLPGTVGQTAAEIDELGGKGIAVACDHHDDAAVLKVFERVREEQGRLDILVNNVFSAPDLAPWLGKNFWELPIEAWDQCIDIGVRSHYVASAFAVPLMLETGPGLIANISSPGAVAYSHNVAYGVGKAAVDRLSHDMAVVRYLCDRVAVMNRGEIVEMDEADAIFEHPANDYTRKLLSAVPEVRAGRVGA